MPDYFTLDELRAMPQVNDATKYPEARVEAAAAYLVAIIERETGTSFVPREETAVVDGNGEYGVQLPHVHVLDVLTVTLDGTLLTGYTYTARYGVLRRYATGSTSPTAWPAGVENIEVDYLAGMTAEPPADVKEAALKGTRAHLLSTHAAASLDDRRTSLSTEQGTIQYVVAGPKHPTGYPEVDAMIERRRVPVF